MHIAVHTIPKPIETFRYTVFLGRCCYLKFLNSTVNAVAAEWNYFTYKNEHSAKGKKIEEEERAACTAHKYYCFDFDRKF